MNKEITPEQEIFDILFENINVQHHIQCNIGYRLSGMREAAEKIASKYGLSTPVTDDEQLLDKATSFLKEADVPDDDRPKYYSTSEVLWLMANFACKHSVTPVLSEQQAKEEAEEEIAIQYRKLITEIEKIIQDWFNSDNENYTYCAEQVFFHVYKNTSHSTTVGEEEKPTIFKFYLVDGDNPFFGGYKAGSMTHGEPTILFNCEALLKSMKDEPKGELAKTFKDATLSTLTHEFCHALQEWLDLEFNELQVERILGAYNEKWNVFEAEGDAEDESMTVRINDILQYLDQQPESELKSQLMQLFNSQDLWRKAFDEHKNQKNENQDNS